jgi:hypothetical protein
MWISYFRYCIFQLLKFCFLLIFLLFLFISLGLIFNTLFKNHSLINSLISTISACFYGLIFHLVMLPFFAFFNLAILITCQTSFNFECQLIFPSFVQVFMVLVLLLGSHVSEVSVQCPIQSTKPLHLAVSNLHLIALCSLGIVILQLPVIVSPDSSSVILHKGILLFINRCKKSADFLSSSYI